jgi:nucleotide-binding universal stress UspA family protein
MLAGVAKDELGGPVVCGIGGREVGRRLAAFAAGLAKPLGAPLSAVRVETAISDSADGLAAGLDGPRTAALERGYALLREALGEAERKHAVRLGVHLGDPAATLIAVAATERAQLLVVGAGRRAGPVASLGTVSREVVMRASCPVIVLPHAPAEARTCGWARRLLLCAFDGSDDARVALSVAAAIAERLGAAAFVAHVGAGSVGELEARARTERAALIVAASRGAEGWHTALPGSPPAHLATSGSTPVLFVPPTYRRTAPAPLRVAAAVGPVTRRAPPSDSRPAVASASEAGGQDG